jgi:hypothetical protein
MCEVGRGMSPARTRTADSSASTNASFSMGNMLRPYMWPSRKVGATTATVKTSILAPGLRREDGAKLAAT